MPGSYSWQEYWKMDLERQRNLERQLALVEMTVDEELDAAQKRQKIITEEMESIWARYDKLRLESLDNVIKIMELKAKKEEKNG